MSEDKKYVDYSKVSKDEPEKAETAKPSYTPYQTVVPNLNIRANGSFDAEPVNMLENEGSVVKVESVRHSSDGSLWGKLGDNAGYICIYDGKQRKTFAKEV